MKLCGMSGRFDSVRFGPPINGQKSSDRNKKHPRSKPFRGPHLNFLFRFVLISFHPHVMSCHVMSGHVRSGQVTSRHITHLCRGPPCRGRRSSGTGCGPPRTRFRVLCRPAPGPVSDFPPTSCRGYRRRLPCTGCWGF
jgi:hypothetical protein